MASSILFRRLSITPTLSDLLLRSITDDVEPKTKEQKKSKKKRRATPTNGENGRRFPLKKKEKKKKLLAVRFRRVWSGPTNQNRRSGSGRVSRAGRVFL